MHSFLSRHADHVMGVLNGFDRVLFRGWLRSLAYAEGMGRFLNHIGVLLKDFGQYVQTTTEELKRQSLLRAQELGRPIVYLPSSTVRKEDVARRLLEQHPVDHGLIAVLTCVEPAPTFEIHRSREKKRLELRMKPGKCLHLYHYFQHRTFGFCHVRLQTWFPFTGHVCSNGREWLTRQLEARDIDVFRQENGILWVEDFAAAQDLLDQQLHLDWTSELERLALQVNPALPKILRCRRPHHYWCAHQTEWATDVLFGDQRSLAAVYRPLVLQAITQLNRRDVLRFLGKKLHPAFLGEVQSDFKHRPEGIRVKHSVGKNSVKVYDKLGSVLRVETTVNDPSALQAPRPKKGSRQPVPQPLRKSVADLHRRATVCQEANERYLEALADLDDPTPLKDLFDTICKRTRFHARPVRGLRPWDADDARLLAAVNDGGFVLRGLQNKEIAAALFSTPANCPRETGRRRAKVTRLLRLLRAHGVIRKIPRSHRYQVTTKGRRIIAAILAARNASISTLLKAG